VESLWTPEILERSALRKKNWTISAWLDTLGLQELIRATDGESTGSDYPLQEFLQDLFRKHSSLETVKLSFRAARPWELPLKCYREIFARRSDTSMNQLHPAIDIHDVVSPRLKQYLLNLFRQRSVHYERIDFGCDFDNDVGIGLQTATDLYMERSGTDLVDLLTRSLYAEAYGP
jgi:hypothetical protein